MIRKHLVRTACALAAAVIAGTTIPVLAQEAEETVETQVITENEETGETVTKKKKHGKHKGSKITETDENGNVIEKKEKKEKKTETAEDSTVTEKKERKHKTKKSDSTVDVVTPDTTEGT